MSATVPILRFEVERMKHTVSVALMQYAEKMNSDIQRCVEEALDPAEIEKIISAEASRQIKAVIAEEIHRFFYYDEVGSKFVRDAVTQRMREKIAARDRLKTDESDL